MLVLRKSFDKKQVLDMITDLALEDVPEGIRGDLAAEWNEKGGVDVYFVEKSDSNNSC